MEEQDQSGEKEFAATEERLRQAREDGDVPVSKEANAAGLIVGIGLGMLVFLMLTSSALNDGFASMFYHADRYATDIFTDQGSQTRKVIAGMMYAILPLFAVLVACVLLALILQRAIAFSTKKVKPDMKKINPVENIKNKYAGLIAAYFMVYFASEYYAAAAIAKGQLVEFTLQQILKLILFFGAFQIVLALLDLPLQQHLHAERLKMTREEVKKEMKQSEGDPHLKQQRRERGTQITRSDMLKNVEAATVVMVSPPTARSLYSLIEVDEEIRQEHFAAVAAAIQYVDRVRQHLKAPS